ncbi:unnamed protein product [Brassica oleracea]|nr:unnamed protein product [Brassica napus]
MIVSNLKLVVFPNPNREDPGKALRDWDLWGPFFFIVFLGLMLSWSPSVKKAKTSLDSALLLAFDLTHRTDSQLMSMIRYAINHIVKFTIKCCGHSEVFAVAFALLAAVAVILNTKCIFSKASTVIQATVYKHLIKAGSIYSISGFDVTQSNLNDSPLSI